jgi:biofilm PGA synthesis N-glycosyltransferase PgaC
VRLVFWLSFTGVLYTHLGYPVLIWICASLRPRRWITNLIQPSVSIVLAVHNGAPLLRWKIDHLLNGDYPRIKEIIIVSDGSTDGTAEILMDASHATVCPIILREQVGKAAALNAGVERASAEIVLFVDIRPRIGPGAIQQLVNNFSDPRVGCVTGELSLQEQGHDATTSAIGSLYWRYEQWIRKCESAFDSPVGVYGGFYAVRRSLLVKQPDGMILDDMFQPLSVIQQGYRSVLDASAKVYDTWPSRAGGEFNRKVRTLAGNYQLFRLAPRLLTPGNRVFFQLVSHKLMRLIVPFLLVLILLSSGALSLRSHGYAGLALAQALVWITALLSLRFRLPLLHRFAAPAGALLVLNAAAVMGLYRFLVTRGPLWRIWNTERFVHMG